MALVRLGQLKDLSVPLANGLVRVSLAGGEERADAMIDGLAALAKLAHLLPTRLRSSPANLCRLGANAPSAKALFDGFIARVAHAFKQYARLHAHGVDAILPDIRFEAGAKALLSQTYDRYGAAVCVVPHCVGSVLSAARLGRDFPARFLVREPKSKRRRAIQMPLLDKLGMDLVRVRRHSRAERGRQILRALRDGAILIGTTDLARPTPERIRVSVFGHRASLPGWPARFATRRGIPIIPSYVRIRDGAVWIRFAQPVVTEDETEATARWAAAFEREILASPSDWVFQFDKQWKRNLAAAVEARRRR